MSSFIKEFREFVSRGNVMDMAVGIIIGGAFTNIVTKSAAQAPFFRNGVKPRIAVR